MKLSHVFRDIMSRQLPNAFFFCFSFAEFPMCVCVHTCGCVHAHRCVRDTDTESHMQKIEKDTGDSALSLF